MSLSLWMFKVKILVLKLSFRWRNEYLGLFMYYLSAFKDSFSFLPPFLHLTSHSLWLIVIFPSKDQSHSPHLSIRCHDCLKIFEWPSLSSSLSDFMYVESSYESVQWALSNFYNLLKAIWQEHHSWNGGLL